MGEGSKQAGEKKKREKRRKKEKEEEAVKGKNATNMSSGEADIREKVGDHAKIEWTYLDQGLLTIFYSTVCLKTFLTRAFKQRRAFGPQVESIALKGATHGCALEGLHCVHWKEEGNKEVGDGAHDQQLAKSRNSREPCSDSVGKVERYSRLTKTTSA